MAARKRKPNASAAQSTNGADITTSSVVLKLLEDVDAACVAKYDEGEDRKHLGASLIGHGCARFLWFGFRWVKHKTHSGRMYRLFQRGHLEEARFVDYLTDIGFNVISHIETDEGPKQIRVSAVHGHFGGSLDGVSETGGKYGLPLRILTEFKTHNSKSFCKLAEERSVKLSKPQHYAQMCYYGYKGGYDYALYCAVNKEDDDLYFEIVKLDFAFAQDLERKAEMIITAQTPPPRISETETYWECKFCDFLGVCHRKENANINCRSCSFARPIEGGQWACYHPEHTAVIPDDFIPVGCGHYASIT